jgi:hypothetical protein
MTEITKESLQELKALSKLLAVMGVRNNTELENLHSGISPSSKVGDYSDVKVISTYGEIEWNQLSRFDDEAMRSLMLSIERALELALCSYESLSSEEKKAYLKFIMTQRSYDRQDFGTMHKQD